MSLQTAATVGELGEFELIERLSAILEPSREQLGDDCALLSIPEEGRLLAATCDSMINGVHFRLPGIEPESLGWKLHARTVSDLAAAGAAPAGVLVNLQLPPEFQVKTLEAIYCGLRDAGARFGAPVVGGDVARGSVASFTASAFGFCRGAALRRSGARAGDDLWLSGSVGWSAAGLAVQEGSLELDTENRKRALDHHYRPQARIELGRTLSEENLATAAVDISDGLLQDAGHISARSRCRLELVLGDIPLPEFAGKGEFSAAQALTGGDDYELLFAAGPEARQRIESLSGSAAAGGVRLTRIGAVQESSKHEVLLLERGGRRLSAADWLRSSGNPAGYSHFA